MEKYTLQLVIKKGRRNNDLCIQHSKRGLQHFFQKGAKFLGAKGAKNVVAALIHMYECSPFRKRITTL